MRIFSAIAFVVAVLGVPVTDRQAVVAQGAPVVVQGELHASEVQQLADEDCVWTCSCKYYFDSTKRKWYGGKGPYNGTWRGKVEASGRHRAEWAAEEVCEESVPGVDCITSTCSCVKPRPKGRC